MKETVLEHIQINPADELLKAIEIVHGSQTMHVYRRVVEAVREKAIRQSENNGGAGI